MRPEDAEDPVDSLPEEYVGPVTVRVGARSATVPARLTGRFQPIDGRFHWYGRLVASSELEAIGSGASVVVATERGSATGRLSDPDPWGRLRVAGTGAPPY